MSDPRNPRRTLGFRDVVVPLFVMVVLGLVAYVPILVLSRVEIGLFVPFAVGFALVAIVGAIRMWLKRDQTLANWRRSVDLCTKCGYPRRGLQETDPCPECGNEASVGHNQSTQADSRVIRNWDKTEAK